MEEKVENVHVKSLNSSEDMGRINPVFHKDPNDPTNVALRNSRQSQVRYKSTVRDEDFSALSF